ncbi:MAG TPA: DUF6152 family protein [Gammaproteobacteria bacterium]|jgi:hypothetical protein|nr:DUF6152 family protein [Gammaproteobacteria bacterium]
MNRSVRGFVIGLSLLLTTPVFAHHSIALYDTDHLTTVKGTVTRIEWTSPHVFVFFAATEPGGTTTEWSMELDPPVLLKRYGWSKDLVKVGDVINCTGAPARSGAKAMRGAIVELPDGTQLRVWSRV